MLTKPKCGICRHDKTTVAFTVPETLLIRANGTSRLSAAAVTIKAVQQISVSTPLREWHLKWNYIISVLCVADIYSAQEGGTSTNLSRLR